MPLRDDTSHHPPNQGYLNAVADPTIHGPHPWETNGEKASCMVRWRQNSLKHGLDNAAIQIKEENNSKGENAGPVLDSALN